jgi:sulfate adenylyltransferase subunit 2
VVVRGRNIIVVDDESRMRFQPGDILETREVRFRTLGCWPVTGAIESQARDISSLLSENIETKTSERQGRIGDGDLGGSLEAKKREGYF